MYIALTKATTMNRILIGLEMKGEGRGGNGQRQRKREREERERQTIQYPEQG